MTATIPYIRGTSETIALILQTCNVCVAHKPTCITTFNDYLLMSRTKINQRTDREQYTRSKCCDCQATYMGETERDLSMSLTEHK